MRRISSFLLKVLVASIIVGLGFAFIARAYTNLTITQSADSVVNNITVNGVGSFADGSVSAPSITFTNDLDLGYFRRENNVLGVSAGGSLVADFRTTSTNSYVTSTAPRYLANNGSVGNPAFSFSGDDNNGLLLAAADQPRMSAGGVGVMTWASTVILANVEFDPAGDNLIDLGDPTLRWKAAYVGTGGIASSGTVTSTKLEVLGTGTTSTAKIGETTGTASRGCIALGDSDGSGITYCTGNGGTLTCGTTACN